MFKHASNLVENPLFQYKHHGDQHPPLRQGKLDPRLEQQAQERHPDPSFLGVGNAVEVVTLYGDGIGEYHMFVIHGSC